MKKNKKNRSLMKLKKLRKLQNKFLKSKNNKRLLLHLTSIKIKYSKKPKSCFQFYNKRKNLKKSPYQKKTHKMNQ